MEDLTREYLIGKQFTIKTSNALATLGYYKEDTIFTINDWSHPLYLNVSWEGGSLLNLTNVRREQFYQISYIVHKIVSNRWILLYNKISLSNYILKNIQ